MTEIAKPKSNTQVTQVDPVTFGITPISSSKINPQAVAIVNEGTDTLSWLSSSFRCAIIHKLTITQETSINQDLWWDKQHAVAQYILQLVFNFIIKVPFSCSMRKSFK